MVERLSVPECESMCLRNGRKMREVMGWVVLAVGVSVMNEVAAGVPMTRATSDGRTGIARRSSDSKGEGWGVLQGTMRVLSESAGWSPADVGMSQRGVRGALEEAWAGLKRVGRKAGWAGMRGSERSFKVLSRNESMVVVGVAEAWMASGSSVRAKGVGEGNDVVVAVEGRGADGRNETREIRIKIDGNLVASEQVYLYGDGGDRKWGTKIMIPLSERGTGRVESGEGEEGEGEEGEDEEGEDEEARGSGLKTMSKYVVSAVMVALVVGCVRDLQGQWARYGEERGKALRVARLAEHGQTIYSRTARA